MRRPIPKLSSRKRVAARGKPAGLPVVRCAQRLPGVRLANDERFGIWGGLSERERRRLKKRAVVPPLVGRTLTW